VPGCAQLTFEGHNLAVKMLLLLLPRLDHRKVDIVLPSWH
jgi:hypothetical protein